MWILNCTEGLYLINKILSLILAYSQISFLLFSFLLSKTVETVENVHIWSNVLCGQILKLMKDEGIS